ncbi:MAG TPA: glycosyltransferase family 2 protein [Bryobacteraceae bacterium]|nr:glycosyltransferase family 2 protein [Bryobacteraceae bacterium]
MSAHPLVSIITPTYNMAQYLPQTIESVLAQDYPNIEYIVVDGGSTDASLEILERYGSRLRYFSEPDRGPSDAAAKGFNQARGEIFAWLNADDTYLPGAVSKGVEYLVAHPEADIVYGEGWWIDENGARIGRYPTLPFDAKLLERECFICQPSLFMRAEAYRRCPLDPAITQAFDYDLWIRMAKAGIRFETIPDYLANSRMHSGAKTLRERENVFDASMGLLKRHYGYIPLPWIFGYTAYRMDHRDQFFEPLRPSALKYLASLPVGLWYNRRKPFRFAGEWLVKGARYVAGRR